MFRDSFCDVYFISDAINAHVRRIWVNGSSALAAKDSLLSVCGVQVMNGSHCFVVVRRDAEADVIGRHLDPHVASARHMQSPTCFARINA
jgi:hypothetical protein